MRVSIHDDKELKEPCIEGRIVGNTCTVEFKKSLYKGKIACIGMHVDHTCVLIYFYIRHFVESHAFTLLNKKHSINSWGLLKPLLCKYVETDHHD